MMSGRDPGELGFYGFRNRKDHSYDGYAFANSRAVKVDRVWDLLSRAGKQVILLGVPQTYPHPPSERRDGVRFPHAVDEGAYTHPPELKAEVERVSGGYVLDVEDFRRRDKEDLLKRATRRRRSTSRSRKHLAHDAAVGLLHDGGDGRRPHAPRVLELHGSGAPEVRGRATRSSTRSATTTATWTREVGELLALFPGRHGGARRLGPRREDGWTAASASTSG